MKTFDITNIWSNATFGLAQFIYTLAHVFINLYIQKRKNKKYK